MKTEHAMDAEKPTEEVFPLFRIDRTPAGRFRLMRRRGFGGYEPAMHGPGFLTRHEAEEALKAAYLAE
jgi:hypothetical protein